MLSSKQDLMEELTQKNSEAWRTFRIMAELVTALDEMNTIRVNCISIFGSARSAPESSEYRAAETLARLMVKAGYGVITGGGPGVMEAANKGAYEEGGVSVGLHIRLPQEQHCNKYVKTRCNFHYFFIRKFIFVKYAKAYIVMPGGMGTLDELSEAFVLAQTGRSGLFPIVLFDSSFWNGLLDWFKDQMVKNNFINKGEISRLITVCDTPEEVLRYIKTVV